MFSKNIRIIYLYIVSFISLMIIIGGLINLSNCIAEYCYPTNYYNYAYPASDVEEKYLSSGETQTTDIAYKYNYYEQELENSKIRSLREIFTSIVTVGIATILYSFHWGIVKKEREQV